MSVYFEFVKGFITLISLRFGTWREYEMTRMFFFNSFFQKNKGDYVVFKLKNRVWTVMRVFFLLCYSRPCCSFLIL
ncbi:MAG: hypothetical protein ACD_63C00220G0002 [uncultured bacterium]|nr:MAG: hypothetical protein ACD_63C00220G0002 [uncultured bacterium]